MATELPDSTDVRPLHECTTAEEREATRRYTAQLVSKEYTHSGAAIRAETESVARHLGTLDAVHDARKTVRKAVAADSFFRAEASKIKKRHTQSEKAFKETQREVEEIVSQAKARETAARKKLETAQADLAKIEDAELQVKRARENKLSRYALDFILHSTK